jgi:hypothetical protein
LAPAICSGAVDAKREYGAGDAHNLPPPKSATVWLDWQARTDAKKIAA